MARSPSRTSGFAFQSAAATPHSRLAAAYLVAAALKERLLERTPAQLLGTTDTHAVLLLPPTDATATRHSVRSSRADRRERRRGPLRNDQRSRSTDLVVDRVGSAWGRIPGRRSGRARAGKWRQRGSRESRCFVSQGSRHRSLHGRKRLARSSAERRPHRPWRRGLSIRVMCQYRSSSRRSRRATSASGSSGSRCTRGSSPNCAFMARRRRDVRHGRSSCYR
jgi:hypothetical protein